MSSRHNKLRAEHRGLSQGAGSARWVANKARVNLMHKEHDAERMVRRTFQAAKRGLGGKIRVSVQAALDEAKKMVAAGTPPAEAARLAAQKAVSKSGVAGMGCPPRNY